MPAAGCLPMGVCCGCLPGETCRVCRWESGADACRVKPAVPADGMLAGVLSVYACLSGCRSCGELSFFFGKDKLEGGGELVGARGGLGAAAYAFEPVDDLLG